MDGIHLTTQVFTGEHSKMSVSKMSVCPCINGETITGFFVNLFQSNKKYSVYIL